MYTYAAKVDIGVSEEQNDDRALVSSILLTDGEISGKIEKEEIVAAICDGVGGLAQGYRAAMITLERISHLNKKGISIAQIQDAIEESNIRVKNTKSIEQLHNAMMSTIAGIYADGDRFIVFNAGDSRIYRFRFKYIMQLSKDHSLVQDLIDLGEITPEEAKNHEKRNVINKCIGYEECVNARIIDMSGDFSEGDILMICSDGISDVLNAQEIRDIIMEHKEDEELKDCCKKVYEMAIQKGSLDNLSIILLRKEQ